MLYHHFGDKNKPPLVLLHGGGISCWMWEPQIEKLKEDFHIIAPIIDGHDIDEGLFSTISDAADRLIAYINDVLDGHIFALCGFSLGAQIALEVLSKRPSIANFAIIESALTEPMGWLSDLALPMVGLSYGLV
ncbi:MAG: alpha/beta hydrolase, partial [Eubacteriales bacterium]